MSDSYTAYCERLEEESRLFSSENVNDVKTTAKFKRALKKAKDACASTKICKAKTCANCAFMEYINSKDICTKLGVVMHDLDCFTCDKWRGSLHKVSQPNVNEDAIAWTLINKM